MIDDTQLDMLVDGELGEVERRDVFARLETEPDGWRRCALAFLEAQSWRQAMQSVSDGSGELTGVSGHTLRSRQRLRTVLAMACSLLLALGVGLVIGGMLDRDQPLAPAGQLAEASHADKPVDVESSVDPIPEVDSELDVPVQYVAIPAQNPVSGDTDSIHMPVVPQQYLGEGWPYQLPAVLPEHVVHTLERRGHEVVQHRRLVPFQTADGRRVVFPVDEVELVPVRNRGYQ